MKKIFTLSLMGAAALFLAGCGVLRDNNETQNISVLTSPPGAKCELTNDKGTWIVPKTPTMISIKRSMYGLTVICRKPGFVPTTGIVTAKAKNVYLTVNPSSFRTIQDPKVTYVYPQQVKVILNRALQ